MEFKITISDEAMQSMRDFIGFEDVVPDEFVIGDLFYVDGGYRGDLDLREVVHVEKL